MLFDTYIGRPGVCADRYPIVLFDCGERADDRAIPRQSAIAQVMAPEEGRIRIREHKRFETRKAVDAFNAERSSNGLSGSTF